MCNAHQHHAGCVCGFGGDGHKGRGGNFSWLSASPYCIHEDGFCRKTSCPKCGCTPVYFIRHNGGCVWVNSLGIPWPKHECMIPHENKMAFRLYDSIQLVASASNDYLLAYVKRVATMTGLGYLSLTVRSMSGQTLGCHVKRTSNHFPEIENVHKTALGGVVVSFLDMTGRLVSFTPDRQELLFPHFKQDVIGTQIVETDELVVRKYEVIKWLP